MAMRVIGHVPPEVLDLRPEFAGDELPVVGEVLPGGVVLVEGDDPPVFDDGESWSPGTIPRPTLLLAALQATPPASGG
jgi:hypothetical protein